MQRLKEASSWASLAGVLAALASVLPQFAPHLVAAATIAGAIGTIVPEQGAPK